MINLYGSLGKRFKKKYDVSPINIPINVRSVSELMNAMEANFKGFKKLINKKTKYNISRGDNIENSKTTQKEELELCFDEATWNILPVAFGFKEGVLQTVIGGLLVVAGLALSATGLGVIGGPMIKLGMAAALGGVAQMLASTPSTDYGSTESADENPSYLFTGPTNSVGIGAAIPVIYGKC